MQKLDLKEAWGADKLEAELESARDELRGLDKNIRKILGKDLPDGENAPLQQTQRNAQKRSMQQEDRRRVGNDFTHNEHQIKKGRWQTNQGSEPKTVFSRLSARVPYNADDSADEDDGIKPAVSSRVIATPREVPSRQEVIRRERVDERSRQRNKRMFGLLLGTLQKFRQEETKLKAKEDKKAEVEARVEEAKRKEKEELKKERQQLFLSRKKQIAEVKALEAKVARSRQFQEWQAAHLPLRNFIKTRTQPAIYYLPKRMNERTSALLTESADELKEKIDQNERSLIEELQIIEAQAGFGKSQTNDEAINVDMETGEQHDGEENRDPNPDTRNGTLLIDKEDNLCHVDNIEDQETDEKQQDSAEDEQKDDSFQDEVVQMDEHIG